MNDSKGQTIFLSVIGIATLLVAIIGATFAWFSVNVEGNQNASSILVTTALLGNITFVDGSLIDMSNIRPESSPLAKKEFTINNETENATETLTYQIWLNVRTNTLSEVAGDNLFVHSVALKVGGTTGTGHTVSMSETNVPAVGSHQLGSNGTLNGKESHTYEYTIQFKEANSDQNIAQKKEFVGALEVKTVATTTP